MFDMSKLAEPIAAQLRAHLGEALAAAVGQQLLGAAPKRGPGRPKKDETARKKPGPKPKARKAGKKKPGPKPKVVAADGTPRRGPGRPPKRKDPVIVQPASLPPPVQDGVQADAALS